ncbi:Tol-Pal system beta propeller repeat protein TolB [Glaesserella parasuis]|uniref:Tol-Pal system beta propeller repeat protein TolB n=1 Tax=Glaesserella parasuis TaxID=738 RepID=UPI0013655257|nr:Tol-Pal system beta propeller repeat protein TolB [Glaesserella parasuis]MCT8729336.1 Tol-Pal system beta propeller repeat protein TolB [Glaesserella parasuis]MCT8773170.1 Tol-Pal system beta propeller repeat protein TolB [Glaesserella parasuis]MCT8806801.1 Tol-Pal system beta propeller repeat protein TolB [Glaesserella parasuis]MDG6236645.1 Tol-Pal system beta propeller repeat protein TolB [Glaesserella parasuis]MDG6264776.1 Tol-Pal system beta propeller repeat protein TolB [Glaesserella p
MKLVSRLTSILGIVGLFFSVGVKAESDVRISIDQGVSMAQPIAVIPFKAIGGVPDDVAQIIADDLRNSGKFTPLDRASLPAQPSSAAEVNPEQWTNIGIDNVIVGQVSAVGGGYNIAYQLVDTLGTSGAAGNVIAQGSFNVPAAQMRLGAHTVSDQVFEKLTQIRGAFRTKIAYVVQRGVSSYELRVSDYDGFNAFTIVKSKEPLMSPEWSPDGSKLAYVTFENKKSQVVVHDIRSGARKVIGSLRGHNGAPSFSPDGSRVAFASNQDGVLNIYVTGVGGGSPRQLTSNAGNNTEPSWSPDGGYILFTSDRGGLPQVYQMSSSGGGASLIGGSGSGKISADGKNLIMVSGDRIVRRDLVSGSTEAISSTFLDESPSISPNGTMVIYSSTKGVSKVLQLVSADGRFKANLPGAGGQYKFPAWSPYLTKQ